MGAIAKWFPFFVSSFQPPVLGTFTDYNLPHYGRERGAAGFARVQG
jgi:hypothetical protein